MQTGELRARRFALESLWQQGLSGRALLRRHTELIDAHLAQCFAECQEARQGVAVVALGGYGRCELFPFSDLDLLLLYAPEVEQQLPVITEALLYPLWDAGLEVGHSVRTPEACLIDAQVDFFLQVALLDARLVTGSQPLFAELHHACRQTFVEGQRQKFFREISQLRQERHQRYGMHSYLLEPHLKESRGGFRDIQAMLWTALVVFGLRGLKGLEEAGILSFREKARLGQAWDSLVRIRNQLHYLSGRKNDQLYFEHQEEMAAGFGYRTGEHLLGVEQFMREVYGHLQTVAVTTDLFFEHVSEVFEAGPASGSPQVLEPGIELRRHALHLTDPALLEQKPHLLLRLFAHAARADLPVHHRTKKLVTTNLHLINDQARASRRLAKPFLEILESPAPLPVLTSLLETGLLTAYLPELSQVVSLVQHDVYHVFTVDRHLLQSVAELARLRQEEAGRMAVIDSPRVLSLAALLHDIGKGSGTDHATRGEPLARSIGRRLGLPAADLDCLAFLVENHLFLMETAQRRDLEDESFLIRCAEKIGDANRLDMLYLLSIADARATGPAAWSDWKAVLLFELYLRLAHLLGRSDLKKPERQQGVLWMREQLKTLLGPDDQRLQELPEDYLLSFSPQTIMEHLQQAPRLEQQSAVVLAADHGQSWSVLVMARDRTGLLARICGTLALHGLEVLSAQIFTWPDTTAVDILQVHPAVERSYAEQDWQALARDLNLVLENRLALAYRLIGRQGYGRFRSRKNRLRSSHPSLKIDNQISETYTLIELQAERRSGLLYETTNTLAELAISIHRAKIATRAAKTIHTFYVSDSQGSKIEEAAFLEEIRQSLLYVAGAHHDQG